MSKQKSEDKLDASMRVLKTGTCKTISGRSTLTYHVGATPDSEVHFRIYSNSGGGMFSKEWIPLKGIQEAFRKQHKGSPITAYLLQPLYRAKSVNTPAFLLSALSQEKLVGVLKGKKREHEILDPSGFMVGVEKLIASGVDIKVKEPVRKSAAKTAGETASKPPIKKTATKKATVKKTAGRTVEKAATKKAAIKKRSMSRQKKSTAN